MFNWVIYHYLFWTGSHFLPAFKSDFFPDCLTIPVLDIFQKTNEHVFHHRAVLPTSYKGISYWPFNVNFWTFNTQREQWENQTKAKTSGPSLSGNQSKTRYVIPTHLFVFRCSRLLSRQIIQIFVNRQLTLFCRPYQETSGWGGGLVVQNWRTRHQEGTWQEGRRKLKLPESHHHVVIQLSYYVLRVIIIILSILWYSKKSSITKKNRNTLINSRSLLLSLVSL